MKLNLCSSIKINKDYYLVEEIFDAKVLINKNRNGIAVLNDDLIELYSFYLDERVLINQCYFNEDRSKLLCYDDSENHLYYINLRDQFSKPIKYTLVKGFSLGPYYVWDNNVLIIEEVLKEVFVKYNLDKYDIDVMDEAHIQATYPGFKVALDLEKAYYMLYQDIKRQVFIYRTVGDKDNIIYWKDFITNKEIQFPAPAIDIFAAEYLDDLLVLMHEEYVFFYDLDKEIYRLEVKDPFFSMYTRLFKKNGNTYAVSLTGKINPPYQSRIKLYRIDDYKQSIWMRMLRLFKKYWN